MVDRLRRSEANRQRVAKVDDYFSNHGQRFADNAERVLVGEGTLVKMCRKKPKSRQFYLFNDLFVYGSIITKHHLTRQHVIPLEGVKLENLVDKGDEKNGWIVKTPTKSFAVYAATLGEKQEWMLHLERCVRELIKEGRQPAIEHAPPWVPDTTTKVCQCCNSTHFSVVTRRHHCRKCGKVVCGACSQRTFILHNISVSKPSRVCDTCYNRLCNGMNTPAGGGVRQGQGERKMVFVGERSGISGPAAMSGESGDSSESDEEEVPRASSGGEEHEAPKFYRNSHNDSPNNGSGGTAYQSFSNGGTSSSAANGCEPDQPAICSAEKEVLV